MHTAPEKKMFSSLTDLNNGPIQDIAYPQNPTLGGDGGNAQGPRGGGDLERG